jgi:hypothetical protein
MSSIAYKSCTLLKGKKMNRPCIETSIWIKMFNGAREQVKS